jgi:hypothetical protein
VGRVAASAGRYRSNGGAHGRVGDHHLGEPGGVAHDQEGHRLEQSAAVHPAGDPDGRADVGGELGGQDALHGEPP